MNINRWILREYIYKLLDIVQGFQTRRKKNDVENLRKLKSLMQGAFINYGSFANS